MSPSVPTIIAVLLLVGSIGGIVYSVRAQNRPRTRLETPIVSSEAITILMSFLAFLAIAYLVAQW